MHPRGSTEYKTKQIIAKGVRSPLSTNGDKLCSREEGAFFFRFGRRAPPLAPAQENERATSGARDAVLRHTLPSQPRRAPRPQEGTPRARDSGRCDRSYRIPSIVVALIEHGKTETRNTDPQPLLGPGSILRGVTDPTISSRDVQHNVCDWRITQPKAARALTYVYGACRFQS